MQAVVGVVAVTTLLAGCDSSTSAPARPTPTSTEPSPTAPAVTPQQAIRALVTKGQSARYAAVYRVTQPARHHHAAKHATWRVWHTPSALRVDVLTGGVRSTQITRAGHSYSCRATKRHKICFLVARHGRPVPRLFRLLATRLFSSDLRALSRHTSDYSVSAAPGDQPRCYVIRPKRKSGVMRVARGTYCFTPTGVITTVRYTTGNRIVARHLSQRPPKPKVFHPYSSPIPLP